MAGSILLTFALVASLSAVIFYYLSARNNGVYTGYARNSFYLSALLVTAASVLLLYAILTHNYQYKYVYEYSGSDLPAGLLMSTFYAGQEGSFLLWALFSVLTGVILIFNLRRKEGLESQVMTFYSLTVVFLLFMVSPLIKNPFAFIWTQDIFIPFSDLNTGLLNYPFLREHFFTDNSTGNHFLKMSPVLKSQLSASGIAVSDLVVQGRGLNPLLQNFWMQIHPPILFVGFALSAVPYAFAMAALMRNEYSAWVKGLFPWHLAGNMVLGAALMLGGYWAYGVLGWGGYWGWDPVENSSFVPWLAGAALIHTLVTGRRSLNAGSGREYLKTNLILSAMVYLLVLYSTFLTRSGILGDASVHSFADPGHLVYLFLLIFLIAFAILAAAMMLMRRKELKSSKEKSSSVYSKEAGLFAGAAVLIAVSVIVLAGTTAPVFGISVDTSFYKKMSLPFGILIGLLNAVSLLLKWKESDRNEVVRGIIPAALVSALLTVIMILTGSIMDLLLIALVYSSIFALLMNLSVAIKIMRKNKEKLGGYITHLGVAVFLVGVAATSGTSEERTIDLPKGKPASFSGYTLTFKGYEQFGEKYRFNVEIRKGGDVSVVSPVMYFSKFNNGLMREPDIISGLGTDLYVSPLGYDDGSVQASREVVLKKGESADYQGRKITFTGYDIPKDAMGAMMSGGNFEMGASLAVQSNGSVKTMIPKMKSENGERQFVPAEDSDMKLRIELLNLDAMSGVSLRLTDLNETGVKKPVEEVLSIDASIKPLISFVWIGVALSIIGYLISAVRRAKEARG